MNMEKCNVGFIGLGKLGLDCAEVFAEKFTVRGYDIYPRSSDLVKVCTPEETINQSDWIFIAVQHRMKKVMMVLFPAAI